MSYSSFFLYVPTVSSQSLSFTKSHHNLFLAHAATIDGALVGVAIGCVLVGALVGAVGAVVCMVCYRKKNKV